MSLVAITLWAAMPAPAQERVPLDDAPTSPGLDDPGSDAPSGVVGGTQVTGSRWQATVGVAGGGFVSCTGTLIHPKVVLTAAHCTQGRIDQVVLGATDWWQDRDAKGVEWVDVDDVIVHEDYTGFVSAPGPDIALLLLESKVKDFEPAIIADECIVDDYLKKKAAVQVVGYGVTSETGEGFNTELNHGSTKVQMPGCEDVYHDDILTGCDDTQRPNGELGAGGGDVDACYGDSGGPLYLKTDEGDFLVGVTSRAYAGVDRNYPCRDGGIYTRPDKYIKWIEKNAGIDLEAPVCNLAPEVAADPILTKPGKTGFTDVLVDDPDGDPSLAVIEVVEPPLHGEVTIEGDGRVGYTADKGYKGDDRFTVAVSDAGNDSYKRSGGPVTVELEIPVEVKRGFFKRSGVEGCGCVNSGGGPSAAWVVLLGLVGLLLRRR